MAARGDLADVRLADRIFAPHYAAAVQRSAVRRTPVLAQHGGNPVSELLRGETFDVLELSHGYAWGVGGVDGTVGFVAVDALGAPIAVTHVVCATGGEDPIGTRLPADDAAHVGVDATRQLEAEAPDVASAAETLIGVPATPGGRSGAGLDDGGLISLSLSLAGLRSPRFADLQAEQIGHAVAEDAPMLRGDLLFRGSRTAIVMDADTVVAVGSAAVERSPLGDFAGEGDMIRRRLP